MATARMTIGTVFDTVSNAAVAASTVLGSGIKAVNMLDKYVSDAAEKQEIRSLVDMESFETRLQEEVAMEDTQRHIKLKEFMDKSPEHQRLYQSNFDRIAAVLAKRKAA
ncbi:hypothetical protein [Paraburkholderia sp. SIMBA_054]|uniref:hypothetical protein n=1 Tax=Paraburkholderia sp. SIMBA_054 TaxID=3085795 RepID=UPI00397D83CC